MHWEDIYLNFMLLHETFHDFGNLRRFNKFLQELKDQEAHIDNLKASIKAKQTPLSIAKARLAMRTKVKILQLLRRSYLKRIL
jgi:hypothetical protein